jgi:hypothetical protein
LAGVVFFPVLSNGFISIDDPGYLTTNPHVQRGLIWDSFAWAFSSTEQSNWHPLTWISHMVDCEIFGLRPWGHHLTSVLLHAANTIFLFLFLKRTTSKTWASFFAACLFAVHPLRLESVAWVAERKDVLSMFFSLLCLAAYSKYAQCASSGSVGLKKNRLSFVTGGRGAFYGLALALFALALMSKPMMVALPFVLLLLDFWPLRRCEKTGWVTLSVEKVPFMLLTALSCVATLKAQVQGEAVIGIAELPFLFRLQNAVVSYCRYIGKFLCPTNLSIIYPLPESWPLPDVLAAVGILGFISICVWRSRRSRPYLWVGWCWFVGSMVPVIGMVQVGLQAMADRYTYFPGIGLLLMAVWGSNAFLEQQRFPNGLVRAAAFGIVTALSVWTFRSATYWKGSESLYAHSFGRQSGEFRGSLPSGSPVLGRRKNQ